MKLLELMELLELIEVLELIELLELSELLELLEVLELSDTHPHPHPHPHPLTLKYHEKKSDRYTYVSFLLLNYWTFEMKFLFTRFRWFRLAVDNMVARLHGMAMKRFCSNF